MLGMAKRDCNLLISMVEWSEVDGDKGKVFKAMAEHFWGWKRIERGEKKAINCKVNHEIN
jgi:hypothetical protein